METKQQLTLAVSEERWKRAQEWEAAFWRSQNPRASFVARAKRLVKRVMGRADASPGDDWNYWWAEKFEGYRTLPQRIERAVELGCGPYTNMRLIVEGRQTEEVWCSDPLVREYLKFEDRWLARAWRKNQVRVDEHAIEACTFPSDYFDLVVMINVLDHVRDAMECLRQAARIARLGGYFVLGQDLSDAEDVARTGEDIGHPIRIDHETLDTELMTKFETVMRRVLARQEGRNPEAHYGTYVFVGAKKDVGRLES